MGAMQTWSGMKPIQFAVLSTAIYWSVCAAAVAKEPGTPHGPMKAGQIRIEYVSPPNPAHQEIYERVKERHVLERFKDYLRPIRLPRPLLLKFDGCDGESNAWYEPEDHAVTICYEYIAEVLSEAPEETTEAGVTRDGAIVYRGKKSTRFEWESTFLGEVAIPRAIANYQVGVQRLVAAYIADPEFVAALKKR